MRKAPIKRTPLSVHIANATIDTGKRRHWFDFLPHFFAGLVLIGAIAILVGG